MELPRLVLNIVQMTPLESITYFLLINPETNNPMTRPINKPRGTFLINNPSANPITIVTTTAITLLELPACLFIKTLFSCLKLSNLPANDMHPAHRQAIL